MTLRRALFLGALASCSLLAAGVDARAAYTWTTGPVTASAPPSGVTDTFTPNSSANPGDSAVSVSLVTINYTPTSATPVSGSQTLSWTETLTSTNGQSETFSISGTLTIFSASTTGGVAATFGPPTITSTSSSGFSLAYTGYSATAGTLGETADLGFIITPPAAIPEPASLAMMGMGLVGVLGLGLRRMRKV